MIYNRKLEKMRITFAVMLVALAGVQAVKINKEEAYEMQFAQSQQVIGEEMAE